MGQMAHLFEGVRAVLFDLDGTLVETNIDFPLMKREMIALAAKYGIPAAEVEHLDILGVVDYVAARLDSSSNKAGARRARQEAYEKLEQIELAHSEDAVAIPGAAELLDALRSLDIEIGVVTRNCRRAVELSLSKAGISADVLLTRDDVQNTKPHPDHLLQALELLGVEPHEAVMVGDHWMDILGGKAAGMRTVGFLRPGRPHDFFDREPLVLGNGLLCRAAPDLVIRDLRELLACVERLRR